MEPAPLPPEPLEEPPMLPPPLPLLLLDPEPPALLSDWLRCDLEDLCFFFLCWVVPPSLPDPELSPWVAPELAAPDWDCSAALAVALKITKPDAKREISSLFIVSLLVDKFRPTGRNGAGRPVNRPP